MDKLLQKFRDKIDRTDTGTVRSIIRKIHWTDRLTGIRGQRGVGKTTLLLQHIKLTGAENTLYVSLDDLYFTENTLVGLAEDFIKLGGKRLFLDEVHRYGNWAREIKNLYDDHPGLMIVFTGSSVMQIRKAGADLSRRATMYNMSGLSLREYIFLKEGKDYGPFTLDELLKKHEEIAFHIKKEIKPLVFFRDYLQAGYFPFFMDSAHGYHDRLEEIIQTTIDVDIPVLKGLSPAGLSKLKLLLQIIAGSVPFKPNIVKLSERMGISRLTLLAYIQYLAEAGIVRLLYSHSKGISLLSKPEKIYLENTNFTYALTRNLNNAGARRETFFMNQLSQLHSLRYCGEADFLVDDQYIFEIGGKGKKMHPKDLKYISYVAADDIEVGYGNSIPLWLFGFLY